VANGTWNEYTLSEMPAVQTLQTLGYIYIPGYELDKERESPRDVILEERLHKALKKINPWISDNNIKKAIRQITHIRAASLMEANSKIHELLISYTSLEQDLGKGKKKQTIKYIDFETPENNEFIVTNQFRVWGPKQNITPDIVIFINGLPVAVFECKSPLRTNPQEEGIADLLSYQDNERGAPRLFHTNQVVVATCGEKAHYATIETEARYFSIWKDTWPLTLQELESMVGHPPSLQEILLYGTFTREHLLDIIFNFIVFETEGGKTKKKIARYQQYRAVNKALERINTALPEKRGGIVWHTQGSGKSLSMLWLAVKLKRMKELENPSIVVVTDRIDLDTQITKTFHRCKFPNPVSAKGVIDLREKLQGGPGRTIMTTMQKFLTTRDEKKGDFPELSDSSNIFVLVDEAHRTHYMDLATNMRTALPNACYIGFTGTPIDRKDKSTPRVFGSYIDTYDIQQSVIDGATVPIYYEGRLPNVWVEGRTLDTIFDRVFQNYLPKEREKIKRKYATQEEVAKAHQRIEQICLDIINHFETYVKPDGFKAQIVTLDRRTAIRYKEILDSLNGPECEVVISTHSAEKGIYQKFQRTKTEEDAIIEQFKKPMDEDKLSILIVCEKLLTGFDAPVEQVMYLDSPIREHNLLQAIARVNRRYKNKAHGLIVDYYGVSEFLKEALAIFNAEDVKDALIPLQSELSRLQTRHRAALRFFDGVDRNDDEALIAALRDEKVRSDFDVAFRRFAESMNILMPDPVVNPYRDDLQFLGYIRSRARTRYREEQLNLAGIGEKVRALIDEYVRAQGVDLLAEPVKITAETFIEHVESLKTDEAKASEMEHALRNEINVKLPQDPVFYTSLGKRLEEIIEAWKEERISTIQLVLELEELVKEVRSIGETASTIGLTETEFAFHGILKDELEPYEIDQDTIKKLSVGSVEKVEALIVIDWTTKDDVQRIMRRDIKRLLREEKVPEDRIEPITLRLLDLARVRLKR
jgi:type I restriction enzyme R subunit